MKNIRLYAFLALLLAGCAQVARPPGGPEDETPPVVVSTVPDSGATMVDTSVVIRIEFSEHVNRETLRSAFGFSPPPPGLARVRWEGMTAVISFDPPLLPDRTYVVSLGTQLADTRRNTLDSSYVLPFSTGEKLDVGHVRGRLVADDNPKGWYVAGYFLSEDGAIEFENETLPIVDPIQPAADTSLMADTTAADTVASETHGWPDPAYDEPDATTQTGLDGIWQLTHLRAGWWRIFAYRDQDADRLWTPWLERIAVPSFDVQVYDDTLRSGRDIVLRESSPLVLPAVAGVNPRLKTLLSVRFDREPREFDATFSLTDLPPAEEGEEYPSEWRVDTTDFSINTFSRGFYPGDSALVRVGLEKLPRGDAVGLRVLGSFGTKDTLDTTIAVDLTEVALRDTFPPILVFVRPEAQSRLHPDKNQIQFVFDEPMQSPSDSAVRMFFGRADTLYPEVQRPFPSRYVVDVPKDSASGSLTLQLLGEGVRDQEGNALEDSLLSYNYIWISKDSLGTISGTVSAPFEDAPVHLTFHSVQDIHLPLSLTISGPGEFTLSSVPSGRWLVSGWQDVSRTGSWYPGYPAPFDPSDPMTVSGDTIEVRARWEVGGNEIIFP